MRLPSASGVDRAMLCIGSTVLPQADVSGEHARGGNWKHDFWGEASREGVERALAAVAADNRDEAVGLDVWLAPSKAYFEVALAYDFETGQAREVPQTDGRRDYRDVRDTEVAVTFDAGWVEADEAFLVDLKTGHGHVPHASSNWQLKVGALALAAWRDALACSVAIVKPGGGEPRWHMLDAIDLSIARDELRALARRQQAAAERLKGGGIPSLSVGSHCGYCKSRLHCPAQTALVRRLGADPVDWASDMTAQLTPETAGIAWSRLESAKKALGEVEGALRMYAKDAPLVLADGRRLRMQTTTVERLDGAVVFEVLAERHGLDVAKKGVEVKATKASVDRAMRPVYEAAKQAGERPTLKALNSETLEAVRARGGVVVEERLEMSEERLELPSGSEAA